MKSLTNLKVPDFTRVLASPYCTAILADNGADVIKIEPPSGDDYRHIGPFLPDHSSSLFENFRRRLRLNPKPARGTLRARCPYHAHL
jgi:CoA:oxalate CoA-transferase